MGSMPAWHLPGARHPVSGAGNPFGSISANGYCSPPACNAQIKVKMVKRKTIGHILTLTVEKRIFFAFLLLLYQKRSVQGSRFKGNKMLISITLYAVVWTGLIHPLGEKGK
jgi:hypothetical protein